MTAALENLRRHRCHRGPSPISWMSSATGIVRLSRRRFWNTGDETGRHVVKESGGHVVAEHASGSTLHVTGQPGRAPDDVRNAGHLSASARAVCTVYRRRDVSESGLLPERSLGKHLGARQSVHLSRWPEPKPEYVDAQLVADMALAQHVVTLGRSARGASSEAASAASRGGGRSARPMRPHVATPGR